MDVLDVGTALGRVRLWERPKPADPSRPLVLAISGAFSPLDYLWWLDDLQADYQFAQLPGFHSPALQATSIEAFADAFDQAMARLHGDRPFVAVGASTGALVAMSLRRASATVAVEPFLRTAPLWAFHEFLARYPMSPEVRVWADAIFGDQDYRSVLEGLAVPCQVIVGDVPLEPRRPIRGLPSLTSAADREALGRHPLVELSVGPGGHDVDRASVRAAVDGALRPSEGSIGGEGVDGVVAIGRHRTA